MVHCRLARSERRGSNGANDKTLSSDVMIMMMM